MAIRATLLLILLVLAGCGDAASTYDPKRGRYVDTQEYHHLSQEMDRQQLARSVNK